MKKRILFIPSTMGGGVYYYRVYTPMKNLIEKHPDDFEITIDNHWKYTDTEKDEIGKNFEIVCFHQCLFTSSFQEEVWKMIIYCKKQYNTKFVLDIDDYWDYHKNHPAREACVFNMFPEKMMMNFKLFDYVTTTTEYFKNIIKDYFPEDKIYVFENGIYSNDEQFSIKKNKSDKIRIGLTGGSSHTEDIKQLLEFPKYLTDKQLEEIELVFCGYDVNNAEKVTVDEKGKIISKEKLDDKDNWWVQTENKFKQEVKNYKRIETKDIMKGEFGKIYEDIDVLLVPLTNNKFNRCKSELKFIEAGFTNTAVISSKVIPYSNFGVNEEDCLFVKEATPQAWAKAIKKILRDKDLLKKIKDINCVRVKYSRSLEDITEKRYKFFSEI